MAQLIITSKSPIKTIKNSVGHDYFNLIKKQSLGIYEKIITTKNEEDLDFYLPQTFNHILSAITSVNQFLIHFNLFTQEGISKGNNDGQYDRNILETIFAHHDSLDIKGEFSNKLSPQFNYLFKIFDTFNIEETELKRLKEIAIILVIVESFFRHHQAHGLSGSLMDFFRGYNIGIHPAFFLNNEYLKNFDTFHNQHNKLYFSCPEDEFINFRNTIQLMINKIEDCEKSNKKEILKQKTKESLINILSFSEDKINSKNKKHINPFCGEMIVENRRILFVRSEIIRSYFKYHSLIWNSDTIAQNKEEIDKALSLYVYEHIDCFQFKCVKQVSLTPNSLLEYFKEFIEIIERNIYGQ